MAKKVGIKVEESVVDEPAIEEVVEETNAEKAIAKLIKDNGLEGKVFYTKVFDDGRVAVVDVSGAKYYATT